MKLGNSPKGSDITCIELVYFDIESAIKCLNGDKLERRVIGVKNVQAAEEKAAK